LRGRDDQEPGPSCPRTARGAALHRQRRHVRSGPHDACYSDRRRARLIAAARFGGCSLFSKTGIWDTTGVVGR
jgi:hypothetical protein